MGNKSIIDDESLFKAIEYRWISNYIWNIHEYDSLLKKSELWNNPKVCINYLYQTILLKTFLFMI